MCCSGCLRGHVDVHTDAKTKTETKSRLGELGSVVQRRYSASQSPRADALGVPINYWLVSFVWPFLQLWILVIFFGCLCHHSVEVQSPLSRLRKILSAIHECNSSYAIGLN